MTSTPTTWVLLGDKGGDNGQVKAIVDALGWPVEYRHLAMRPEYVLGKPRFRPSLDHLDLSRSDVLEAPWPELVITVGRRPAMAALWVRQQSGGRSKIVLVGKPSGHMLDFSLVIASRENQLPPMHNFVPVALPLMRPDTARIAAQAEEWGAELEQYSKPLVALLIGGETNPYRYNQAVTDGLIACAHRVTEELGGTPYVSTSRRTPPALVAALQDALPPSAVLHVWEAGNQRNPYQALLGTADAFIVTADSISMIVEVASLGKSLAIYPLPTGWLGRIDQLRRSFAHWLFNPRSESRFDHLRLLAGRAVYYLDPLKLLCATRDFRSFHRMLVARGMAVWAGEPFVQPAAEALPDDLALVVQRIKSLFASQ